jgi:hypothetical protein
VGATWPATRSAFSFVQFLNGAANPSVASGLLLRVVDPADELVSCQHRDAEPGCLGCLIRDEGIGKIFGQVMNLAAG